MRKAKYVWVAFSSLIVAQSLAQSRPATDFELEQIRAAHELDLIPEGSHFKVLGVEGRFEIVQGAGMLFSTVHYQPYLVQDALCLMQSSYKSAREVDDGLAWSNERYGFAYWKAESAQECELEGAPATESLGH